MIDAALLTVAQLLAGWLIADLLGGAAHWLEDRVLTDRVPVLGRYVVLPNRRHHREPMAFAAAGVVARNGTTWVAVALVSTAWLAWCGPSLVWTAATIGGAASSQVHYYAHLPIRAPRWLRVAQEVGLVQSAAQHAGHHRPPSDRRYCVLTDWLNPVLDAIGLWSCFERGLSAVGVPIAVDAP